jgi:hypothetical protein
MTITIQPAPDYLLHFTATPTYGGLVHLKVESQWWGAKDRDALQTKFQVTLEPQEMRQLALEIDKVAKP